jgi:RNA polymerase sigma-70 factor (ECF subfamily)
VAQETFMHLWKQAAQWQPGETNLDTWLHRVALNLCYDRLRSHAHIADMQLPDDATQEQIDPTLTLAYC